MADDGFLGGLFNDPTKVAALSMLAHVFDPFGKDNTQTLVELANSKTQQNAMLLALKQAGLDDDTAKAVASHPAAAKMMLDQRKQQAEQADNQGVMTALSNGFGGGAGAAPPPQQPAPMQPTAPGQPMNIAPSYVSKTISAESGGNPNATDPRSSASGYGGFTNATWSDMVRNYPDAGLTPDGRGNLQQVQKAVELRAQESDQNLREAGFEPNDQTRRLGHFLGPTGASRFLQGARDNPNAPINALVSPEAINANPTIFKNKDGTLKTPEQFFTGLTGGFSGGTSPPVMAQGGDTPQTTPLPQSGRAAQQPEYWLKMIAQYPKAGEKMQQFMMNGYNKAMDENGATPDIKNYRFYYQQESQAGRTPKPYFEWEQASKKSSGEYSKSPIWGTDEAGNPAIGQLSSSGEMIKTKMPEGFRAGKDVIRVDAGTHTILLDPVTRQQIGMIPKNIEQTKVAEAKGEAQGKAITSLPNVAAQGQQALDLIDKAIEHPGRETSTGLSSWIDPRNLLPGTDATNYQAVHNQIRGKVFLDAFSTLRGGGAITEVEGKKAEQAIARLDRAQSDDAYKEALYDLRKVLQAGMARAQVMSQGNFSGGQPAAQPDAQPSNDGWTEIDGVKIRKKQ